MKKILMIIIPIFLFSNQINLENNTKSEISNIVINKIKHYGDFKKFGFNSKLKHEIVYLNKIPFNKHIIVVTASSPQKDYDCHACGVKLSFFELIPIKKSKYKIIKSDINSQYRGSWGRPPNIDIITIGKEKYGIVLRDSYGNGGVMDEIYSILYFDNGKIKEIFSKTISSNDGGRNEPPTTDWNTTIKIVKGSSSFYNIILHKKGIDNGKKINEITTFTFNGKNYIKGGK